MVANSPSCDPCPDLAFGEDGPLDHNRALTGDDLRDFVNLKLFPYLHGFKQKAILLATQRGARPEAILEGIDWTHAYPNQRILGFGEEILGTGEALKELVEEGLKRGGWQ